MLTSAGDREADSSRVPRTNTRDLAEATVSLARQASDAPTRDHAFGSVTLGSAEHVDTLVLRARDETKGTSFLILISSNIAGSPCLSFLLTRPGKIKRFQLGNTHSKHDRGEVIFSYRYSNVPTSEKQYVDEVAKYETPAL